MNTISASDFGNDFKWGVAQAAFQTEGHSYSDGKTDSIWDVFQYKKGAIKTGENASKACNFYELYPEDIALTKNLNFDTFAFSLSWPRILPQGIGQINSKGLDYYDRIIDNCLSKNITPWLTLYHWDLPQILQQKKGWANRDVLHWFGEFANICSLKFGDRVKNWKVLNEPSAFCGFGYMTGEHAPGIKNLFHFLAASHHANLCQGIGANIIRKNVKNSYVGTGLATFQVEPKNNKWYNIGATERIEATINKMYIEPLVGLGYPYKDFPAMKLIENYIKPEDEKNIKVSFDYIGIQYYCRLIGKFSLLPPIAFADEVPAKNRNVPMNNMGFEIYPEGFYNVLKKYNSYPNINEIIVSENGICLDDKIENGNINDEVRIKFFQDYLNQMLRAKNEGVNIKGYFCWTLTDNFEWWEGFKARFGLVYVNHQTQERIIKKSGLWFKDFLK
ncbi:MAG: beta-glucosidase [Cytophagales bacterium]|nr:MAG: beta-glucosidase [Cytophagales bacterium]